MEVAGGEHGGCLGQRQVGFHHTGKDRKVIFRVLVDRPMYELIGGGGVCFKTSARGDMGQPVGKITLTVESLEVYEMASAWKE